MEMVTAMPESANAWLIMSMPKIAHFMDVCIYIQQTFVFLFTFKLMYQCIPAANTFPSLLLLLRWSICCLRFCCWYLDHVIYLKLRRKLLLLQAEQLTK